MTATVAEKRIAGKVTEGHPFGYKGQALGIVRGETDQDYFGSGALGSTMLKTYVQNPFGFFKRYVEKDPDWQQKETPGLKLGTLVHGMVQGMDVFNAMFTVIPECFLTASGAVSRGKEAQTWITEQEKAGASIVTPDQKKMATLLVDRVLANSTARGLILAAEHEVTGRIIHHTGLCVQVKWDLYSPLFLGDLKTMGSNDLTRWKWSVRDYLYDAQAALYSDVHQAIVKRDRPTADLVELPWYWVVVMTQFPFQCWVFQADKDVLLNGRLKVAAALSGIAKQDWDVDQPKPEIFRDVMA